VFAHLALQRSAVLEPDTPVVEYILAEPHGEVNMNLHFAGAIALDKTSTVAPREFVLPLLSGIRLLILREVFPPLERFL